MLKNKPYKKLIYLKTVFNPFVLFLIKTGIFPFLVPTINFTLNVLGLKKRYNKHPEYVLFGNFFNGSMKGKSPNDRSVLFLMMSGVNDMATFRNMMLAKYFEKRGYECSFLVCDKVFSICDRDKIYKSRKSIPFFCYECYGGYRYIEKESGLLTKYMSKYLDDEVKKSFKYEEEVISKLETIDECVSYSYRDIKIGSLAKRSVLYFLTQGLFFKSQKELEVYKRYLSSSILFMLLFEKELIQNKKLKLLIINNGQGAFDSIAAEMVKKRGIDFMTQETFEAPNSWVYKKNGVAIDLIWDNEWEVFKKVPLTLSQKEIITNFMINRRTGKNMIVTMNDSKLPSAFKGNDDRYVALFTNYTWDTTVLDRNSIFSSMNEWLLETIDFWVKEVEGIKLIIRAHPAEVKLIAPSAEYVRDIIKTRLPNSKIVFFDSTDQVNSYEVISKIDYGICYGSSIGLEIAYAGKASVIAGMPYYRNKRGVESPNSKKEYFDTLKKLNENPLDYNPHSDELLKYLYFIFFDRIKNYEGFEFKYFDARTEITATNYNELIAENENLLNEFYEEVIN